MTPLPLQSRHLPALLLLTLLPCLAWAGSSALPQRPQLEHYDSQTEFVKDVLAWERRKRQLEATGRQLHAEKPEPAADPDDWHHITGPENLDEALRKAYGYEQPNYRQRYRYNRTTHLSFPLERLPKQQLSRQAINGALYPAADEERSLEPLPELRTILDETAELLEPGEIGPYQGLEDSFAPDRTPPITHRVDLGSR